MDFQKIRQQIGCVFFYKIFPGFQGFSKKARQEPFFRFNWLRFSIPRLTASLFVLIFHAATFESFELLMDFQTAERVN